MNNAAEKIKALRAKLGLTTKELGALIGVDQSTVSKYEFGKQEPKPAASYKLAELAGVTIGEWIGIAPVAKDRVKAKTIKMVGAIKAGAWTEAVEYFDEVDYVHAYLPPDAARLKIEAFRVDGESMNKSYPNGSIIYVASTFANDLSPFDGAHVVVSRLNKDGGYEATLKVYRVREDGTTWLEPHSYNAEFQDAVQISDDNTDEVTVVGIVKRGTFEAPSGR